MASTLRLLGPSDGRCRASDGQFGFFSMIIGFVQSYGALLAVRFLLGVAETAMLPGLAFWMSRFYRRNELVFRLSLYIVTAPLAGAFGSSAHLCLIADLPHGGLLAYSLEKIVSGGPLLSPN